MRLRSLLSTLASATLALGLTLSLTACDGGDGDDSSDSSSDSSGDTGSSSMACEESVAATMCDPNCAFDPAQIDCMNACQNIADQCASDACSASDSCVGQNQDVATCVLGCQGTINLSCTNAVFGCWDTAGNSNCEDVGVCVNNN